MKKAASPDRTDAYWATTALARGKFNGARITDIADIFVADAWSGEMLTTKVIAGSEGVWGDVPMPPHADMDRSLAKFVVTSIMELKN